MTGSIDAWIYLRKSRDKAELSDPDLLHKHRRELLRLAEGAGHKIATERIYEEIGSGDTLRSRPVCRRLLEAISRLPRGSGGALWTTEVSRLTRGSLSDRARVYEVLTRAAVLHCTRAANYDLRKTTDLMQWEILTTIAQHELGQYKDRVTGARVEMALEGRPQNARLPFGWWWDRNAKCANGRRGRVEIHPVRFPIVQAMCVEVLHLSTLALGAKYGLPDWQVLATLRNPFICGYPAKRHFPHSGDRTRRDTGQPWLNSSARVSADQWLWAQQPGDYQPACSRDQWEAIQRALDARRVRPVHSLISEGWCRDVVRFVGYEDRPARLSAENWTGGSKALTYQLSRPKGERGLFHLYVYREAVHAAVLEWLMNLFACPDLISAGIELYLSARRPGQAPDATALHAEVSQLERRLDALLEREIEAAAAGDMQEVASIARLRQQYKRDLATAQAAILALSRQCDIDPGIEDLASLLDDFEPADLAAAWSEGLDDEARQRVVRGLIQTVPCHVYREPGAYRWTREILPIVPRPWFTAK